MLSATVSNANTSPLPLELTLTLKPNGNGVHATIGDNGEAPLVISLCVRLIF